MHNHPIDYMNLPLGMQAVTKLKTKILLRMDYVLQCETDEKALNGWRLLCADGIALVRMALEEGAFDKLKNAESWKTMAQELIKKWPPKTFEKTEVVREGYGYRANYDGYCIEIRQNDLELGLRSLDKEKYNVINTTQMAFWGDCYSIIMVVGYLDLEEQIEIPVQMDDRYTSERMRKGMDRWADDGQRGNSQTKNVEGGTTRN